MSVMNYFMNIARRFETRVWFRSSG